MDHSDFENAYRAFRQVLVSGDIPDLMPFSYEPCERVEKGNWRLFAGFGVTSDLRLAINHLNAWRVRLHEWAAWLKVLKSHEEQIALELQFHFLDHLMFFCMFQPSGFRDMLAHVATQSVHQGNLSTGKTERDVLVQDSRKGPLKRKEVEAQLESLCEHWTQAQAFIESLSTLDTDDYRRLTLNYRNRASHAIPPRFGWGEVGFLTRSIEPWTEFVAQSDGTVEIVETSLKSVVYSLGGTPPLELEYTYRANLHEHDLASRALEAYCALLDEILLALPVA
ncbi:hypothetical protein [Thiobacillus sp. 65-1402]|mgnify:CR=1 FL=1|uniref:hypothetical protein n=1 Tax=Thiobacillus sp. 65-1402 TaxID=1895861 RepID=UPI00095A00C5|nr:hypothetical protein [Thiobacillus sp. 65-1402]OJW99217.1 MAG: hypothetical protein BGO62_05995 [Thiobacillus sp. 65-1402]